MASVITNKQSAKVHGLGGCQNKFDIKLFCLFGFCLVVWRCFSCFLTFKSHVWQDFHPLTPSLCPQKKKKQPQKTKKQPNFEIVSRESSLYLIDDENILKCFQEGSKLKLNHMSLWCCSGLCHAVGNTTYYCRIESVEAGLEMLEASGALLCCLSGSSIR